MKGLSALIEVGKNETGKKGLELVTGLLTKDHHISNQDEEAAMTGRKEKERSWTAGHSLWTQARLCRGRNPKRAPISHIRGDCSGDVGGAELYLVRAYLQAREMSVPAAFLTIVFLQCLRVGGGGGVPYELFLSGIEDTASSSNPV